jgi:hypothetical protein
MIPIGEKDMKPNLEFIFRIFLSLSLPMSAASTALAAQPSPRPPNPQQINAEARQEGRNLDQHIQRQGFRELQRMIDRGDIRNLQKKFRDAKKKQDDAAKAAKDARDAARNCQNERDKKKAFDLIQKARRMQEDAKHERDMAEIAETGLRNRVRETVEKVNKHVKELKDKVQAGLKAAKDAGLKIVERDLQDTEKILNDAIDKATSEGTKENNFTDEGMLNKLDKAKNEFNKQIDKAKEGTEPSESPAQSEANLKEAEGYLQNCPPKVGAAPKPPVEVFIAVDNTPQVLACIAPGQNPAQAANALGLANHQQIASGPEGTIVRAPGDPKTVEKAAKEKGVKMCHPPENDKCTIMTPLTPFRGHNHKDHMHSDGHPHSHQPVDLPLDWGVTPPETIIRWE